MKNRASTVAGLIENYELIDDVMKSAEEAQGSALKENQRYVESIEGSLNRLSSAWDKLWVNENNREVITFFIDLGRGILEVVDNVGVLNTAIMGIGAFAGIKNVGKRRSTMFHNCFEYADRGRCSLYKIGFLSPIVKYTLVNEATISVEII